MPQPYCVAYPEVDKYYYLYQRYPNFPNLAVEVRTRDRLNLAPTPSNPTHLNQPPTLPRKQGVTNEHFIVWMRTAGLPTFRKLYGRIDQDIPAGTALSFAINPGFEVVSFGGKKHLGAYRAPGCG